MVAVAVRKPIKGRNVQVAQTASLVSLVERRHRHKPNLGAKHTYLTLQI